MEEDGEIWIDASVGTEIINLGAECEAREREAVVRWLRKCANYSMTVDELADGIERGYHVHAGRELADLLASTDPRAPVG